MRWRVNVASRRAAALLGVLLLLPSCRGGARDMTSFALYADGTGDIRVRMIDCGNDAPFRSDLVTIADSSDFPQVEPRTVAEYKARERIEVGSEFSLMRGPSGMGSAEAVANWSFPQRMYVVVRYYGGLGVASADVLAEKFKYFGAVSGESEPVASYEFEDVRQRVCEQSPA